MMFRQVTNVLCGLYLLLILLYLLLRFTVGDNFWPLALVNSFIFLLFIPLPVLLLLAILTRSRHALLSLMPVLQLISLWLIPRFLPKSVGDIAIGTSLRVLTSNIWRLNPTPEKLVDLAGLAKPDVIFLQEVQLSTQGQAIASLDAEYPYQTSLLDEVRLNHYTAVNLTLSRHPFVIAEKIALDLPRMSFIYRNVIEFDRWRVALYNVHLVTPVAGGSCSQNADNYFVQVICGFDESERNQQIAALLAHLQTEPYPYIVAGDFNTSDTSLSYVRLSNQMRDAFLQAGVGLGNSWPIVEALGWPEFLPPFIRMDYIWYSHGLLAISAQQGNFIGSDHLPLLADFAFET